MLIFCLVWWLPSYWQFCGFSLNKSCKTYLGLKPLISVGCSKCSTTGLMLLIMNLFLMTKDVESVSNLFCLCISLVTTVEREHVRESSVFVFLWSFGFSALSFSTPASITEASTIKLFTCVIYFVTQ